MQKHNDSKTLPAPAYLGPTRAPVSERYMDYPRPERETFTEMGTNPWMSKGDINAIVGNLVTTGGYAGRTGDSTTFEVRKQVYGNTISLDMTVTPASVLVTGEIQPGIKDLFRAHDWDVIKNLTPDGLENYEQYLVDLPRYVTVISGGGYKPHFEFYAADRATLAAVVQRIFKVAI